MAQIKTVFPEAYTFRQEKDIPTYNSSIKKGSYQLTVEPIIPSGQNTPLPESNIFKFSISNVDVPFIDVNLLTSVLRPE